MKTQQNEYSNPEENNASFFKRFWIYQRERFPLLAHGILISAFSFSAIAYSRISRGVEGFISWQHFLVGVFTTVTLFLLVRIFDEFKDAKEDAMYRKELPVPRGLISLQELRLVGIVLFLAQIAINLIFFPKMLIIYGIVIFYLCLMGKEFFVADWLKKRPFWYVTSHMLIIPLIDIYASGLDWLLAGVDAPKGLLFFFAVSFMNGIVLEIGRKIRNPSDEKVGVETYSYMLGAKKATGLWIFILFVTWLLSIAASYYAGYGILAYIILTAIFIWSCIPAVLFMNNRSSKCAKMIELTSAGWTIAMYLSLGGVPMLERLFG
ncbi:UbiA family prenyltransferase [Sphingobacterium sp. DN00404]|uniref:UbiA family prenyltransferase n=1 Tax=Sphingobacterium micropteri TaxID=2763501 RepID=A0ABR7YTW8_9SPHI|nr:UbiA family prenyltransferase [Sphingobacterium micropteri]MBD1434784.1 UbiA family prenyltransferase [Sphingobacterium micropteri]